MSRTEKIIFCSGLLILILTILNSFSTLDINPSFQRAEVLVALVETNIGEDIDFCDRLVYDLAWNDYNLSYSNGYLNAKVYRDQLDDFVTTKGDWFLNAENARQISPSSQDCIKLKKSDCYKWLERKVESKR